MSSTKDNVQHVGPKVRVRIEYECNGCMWHQVDEDVEDLHGTKYHACCHPSVIKEHGCNQWFGPGNKDLTIYHIARTPTFLCPYIDGDQP